VSSPAARGIFLNPNGEMSSVNANIVGRFFGGDSQDMQIVSGTALNVPVGPPPPPPPPPPPIPEPASIVLLGTALFGFGIVAKKRIE